MGNLFSKTTPVNSNSTTRTQIPDWLTNAAQGNINYATGLPDYVPYTGQGVAGPSPEQLQAFARAMGNPGMYGGAIGNAIGGAENSMNFALPMLSASSVGGDAAGLLNPYQSNVIDASNREIDRAKAMELERTGAAAARGGAFAAGVPDDRAGLMGTETARNFEDIRAKTNAGLLSGGWDQALKTAMGIGQGNQSATIAGTNARTGAAGALGNIANTGSGMNWADISGLLGAGGVNRGIGQEGLTFNYNDFLRMNQDPYKKLAAMQGATSSAPHDTTQMTNGTQEQFSSPFGQIAGLGLGLAGLGFNPLSMGFGLLSNGFMGPGSFNGARR